MKRHRKTVPDLSEESAYLEAFYTEYRRFIYYIVNSCTKEKDEVEELVQESWVRILQYMPVLKELEKPQKNKYIATIIKTTFVDLMRRKHNNLSLDDEAVKNLVGMEDALVSDIYARWEIQRLQKSLPHRDWTALEGKYMRGYSQKELCGVLGIAPDSVRMVLSRARKKSQKILRKGMLTGGDENER